MGDSAIPLGARGNIQRPETRLYSDGVVVGEDGEPLIVPPGSSLRRVAGTGFLDPSSGTLPGARIAAEAEIKEARERLDAADVPGRDGVYGDMAETALIDIQTLTFPNGAVPAAASPFWRYVWPRDSAFVVAALSRVGRDKDALRLLRFVGRCQEEDGTWQARYLPDGSGRVPDARGVQLDGNGWMLWAAWVWARLTGGRPAEVEPMVRRTLEAAMGCLGDDTPLPTASQDYWERNVSVTTLGTAAPLLTGIRAGRDLAADLGDAGLAGRAQEAADRLAGAIDRVFAPMGYPRRADGAGGLDTSVAFLLPPFAPRGPTVRADAETRAVRADAETRAVRTAWERAAAALALPNGGLRPGEGWADRETAWTPTTSIFAMSAAHAGDTETAHRLLTWLDLRRTRLGSLPEKVTARGTPAAVAPIGIVASCVLLALAALDRRALPTPRESP